MERDVKSLNLFMYVSEIVTALHSSEALLKLKNADVPCVVSLIVHMHQRYNNFTEVLAPALAAIATDTDNAGGCSAGGGNLGMLDMGGSGPGSFGGDDAPHSEKDHGRRRRMAMRLLTELYLVGVFQEVNPVLRALRRACRPQGKEAGQKPAPMKAETIDAAFVVSFAKVAGEDLLGVPKRHRLLLKRAKTLDILDNDEEEVAEGSGNGNDAAEDEKSGTGNGTSWCPPEAKAIFRGLVEEAWKCLDKALRDAQRELRKMKARAERDELTHGSLTDDKAIRLEEATKGHEKMFSIC